jgi:hypothetical protein
MTVRREYKIVWIELIAGLGGLTGIWLGFSCLGLVEAVSAVLMPSEQIIRRLRRRIVALKNRITGPNSSPIALNLIAFNNVSPHLINYTQ